MLTREEAIRVLDEYVDTGRANGTESRFYFPRNKYEVKAALDAAISALREQETVTNRNGLNGWISVEDALPPRFEPVLVCRRWRRGNRVVEQGIRDVDDRWKVYGTKTGGVTHWMPLPEPPEVEA